MDVSKCIDAYLNKIYVSKQVFCAGPDWRVRLSCRPQPIVPLTAGVCIPKTEVIMQSRPSTSSFFKNSKFLDRRWEDLSLEEQNLLNARLERVNKFLNDAANAKEGKINRLCFMYFRQISPIMVFLTDAPPYPDGPIAMVVQRIVARLMEKVEANPSVLEDFRRLREWEPGLQIGIIPTFSRGKRTKPQEIHWTLEEEDKDFLFSCGIHSTVPPPESLPASAAA